MKKHAVQAPAHARTRSLPHTGASCPVAQMAELLGDYCTILLVRDLLKGPKRFKDFTCSLDGVSTKTVAEKLKKLELWGIVQRTEFNERPPRVEYALTKKGKDLAEVTEAMRRFGKRYL